MKNFRSLTTRTRSYNFSKKTISNSSRVYHVYPPETKVDWKKNEFNNLYNAYYGGISNIGDFNMVWERIVKSGDTVKVHAGVYKASLKHYTDRTALVPDGTYWLTAKGTGKRPIVIMSAGDGEVVFDGSGTCLITVRGIIN